MVDATRSLAPEQPLRIPVFQLFGVTFRTFGREAAPFLVLSIVALVPSIFRLVVFPPVSASFDWTLLVFTLVHMALSYLVQTPMTLIAARSIEGQPYTFGEAMHLAARRGASVVVVAFLAVIAVYVGMILLVVPGIIAACVLAVAIPVAALEGLGPIASLKRSAGLTRYNRWRILGAFALFFLPFMIVTIMVSASFTMRGQLLRGQWVSEVLQIVWMPLAAIFSTAIYVALRRLKENVGVAAVFD